LDIQSVTLIVNEIEVLIGNISSRASLAIKERVGRASVDVRTSNTAITSSIEQVARGTSCTLSIIRIDLTVINGLDNSNTFAILDEVALDASNASLSSAIVLAVGYLFAGFNSNALLGRSIKIIV